MPMISVPALAYFGSGDHVSRYQRCTWVYREYPHLLFSIRYSLPLILLGAHRLLRARLVMTSSHVASRLEACLVRNCSRLV